MNTGQSLKTVTLDPIRVIERYPAPIACAYVGLGESTPALERLFALKDLFEVALKYCAIIMVRDYLRLGIQSTPVDSAIAQFLPRPQLGNWNHILREIARSCQAEREKLFVPQLVDFYFEPWGAPRRRGHDLVDELIKFRNQVIAHRARPRGREAERIYETTLPLVEELLSDLSFLEDYKLLSCADSNYCQLHMGAGVPTAGLAPTTGVQLSSGQLYLRSEDVALSLFPLLLYERCGYGTRPHVCELTKFFFFNGGERKPEYVDYLMGHVKQTAGVADAVAEIINVSKQRLSVEMVQAPQIVSADLMREAARGFVGRNEEEEEILRYISAHERGHVTVVGDPGIGKSALLSQIVLDLTQEGAATDRSAEIASRCDELKQSGLAVAFHVCTRRVPESTAVPQILSSLAEQLVKQYGPAAAVPQERSLRALLDVARVAQTHFMAKALLVIDGIDEVLVGHSPPEQREIINSLPLRGHLPDGVFVLLSSRRGYLDQERGDTYELELQGLARGDIRQLLAEVADRYAIAEQHIDAVQHVSQSNALYVRMLVNDLKLGRLVLDEIDRLPLGLEGYFEDFIRRLCVDLSWPALRDCLLLLAVARSHLSVNQVCAMTDLSWAEVEEAIEDKLQPVLVPFSPEIHDYQLFHEKFREFIVALFSGRLSPEVAARLNKHFVREAPPELHAEGEVAGRAHLTRARERILSYCRRWREIDDNYPLSNLPRHLYEADAVDELEILLRASAFLEKKIKKLGDASLAAEDIRYLTLALLENDRDREIVALAVNEHGYQRDGVASALRVAGPERNSQVVTIVQALLEQSDPRPSHLAQIWSRVLAHLPSRRTPPPSIINARRVAIVVAHSLGLGEMLVRASQDRAPAVQALLVPYLYRFWNKDHDGGWLLMDRLGEKLTRRWGLPNIRTVSAYGGLCLAILIYHSDDPSVVERLQAHWNESVRRILHYTGGRSRTFLIRSTLRVAIFALTRMLRLLMAAQPDFQPINLREMRTSFARGAGAEQRVGLEVLEYLEHPERGFAEPIDLLLNKQLPYGLYLMLVVERTLIFHSAKDPGGVMRALYQVHRDGCEWFRHSALYIAYHALNLAERAEDEWLDLYARMTRETISSTRGTFQTPTKQYELLPHIATAEIIFDKHRPQGRAQFIPEFYAEAKSLGDLDYARRVIGACGILSFGYRRHELALDALRPALADRDPQLRAAVVEALAAVRFHAEEAVDRFLESEQAKELAQQVASMTLGAKSNDIFVWVDQYVIHALVTSDYFRAEVVSAFRRAGHARGLPDLLQQILKWVINLSTGEKLLPL
jgi:hypothetical protein